MPKQLSTFDINGRLLLSGAAGTSGQVLTSGGSGTTPTWTTVSGGSGASLSTFNTFTQAQVIQPSDAGPALSLINAERYLTINSYSFSTYYNGDEDVYVTTMNVTSIPGLTSGTYQIAVRSLINNYPVVAASYNNGVFTNENTTGYLTIYAAAPQVRFTPPVLSIRSGGNNTKRFEIGETGVLYLGGAEVADPFPIQAAREGNGGYLSASFEGALNWKVGYLVDYPAVPIVTSDGRLAIASTAGTSGQVLTSAGEGSTPTWTTPGYGAAWTGFASGYNYYSQGGSQSNGTNSLNNMTLVPFALTAAKTFTKIGIMVNTGGTGSTVRLGIYNSTNGIPSSRLLDAGTVATTTSSTLALITISQTLQPGLYWLAAVNQGATCSSQVKGTGHVPMVPFFGSPANGTARGLQVTGVSGALPNPVGTLGMAATPFEVFLQV